MSAAARAQRPWRSLAIPALLAFAALVALGTWQIERKAWKEGLIATLTERLAAPPAPLPQQANWPALDQAGHEFRHVVFDAHFEPGKQAFVFSGASALRPDTSGAGYWVFAPARLADGSIVVVDRGFVPLPDANMLARPAPSGPIAITGALRWPEASHWFTPNADRKDRIWFARDVAAIAAAEGWGSVAPFYVEQEAPVPPGGLPQPGRLVARLRDEHLQYAITWYGLALVLLVVFSVWAFKSGRRDGAESFKSNASPSL